MALLLGRKGIEFETSSARSPPCSVGDNGHLSQQLAQRIMNTLGGLNERRVVRLIGDHVDTGKDRAQVAL
jgi:hypothetical protein